MIKSFSGTPHVPVRPVDRQVYRRAYRPYRPQGKTRDMIHRINQIADEYIARGLDLTVRQVHYQFVARNWGPNTQKHYDVLQRTIADARMGGLLSWDVIVDRTRRVREIATWESPAEIIEDDAASFRLDHWATQPNRVEVWIEKDALGGIVARATRDTGTPWFSMRGFPSVTALRKAAHDRIIPNCRGGQHTTILLLTDHDPCGLKMYDTIREDLAVFAPPMPQPGSFLGLAQLSVRRIALTREQVDEYAPPPNFSKEKDPNRDWYERKTGSDESWELDALDPPVLIELIQDEIESFIDDRHGWRQSEERERECRALLDLAADRWDEVAEFLDAA